MNIIHLPPDAIPLLDALLDDSDTSEATRSFSALRDAVRRWLDFHGAYTLHEEDANLLANVEVFWTEVDQALTRPSPREILDALLPALYQAVDAMDRVTREREKPHFSLQRPVNDFLMACAAYKLGRAQDRAITDRLPVMDGYLASLETLFGSTRPRLKPEVVEDVEKGLALMRISVEDARRAHNTGDLESLHDALAGLSAGASLMDHFLEWERADRERLAERHTRFNIPVVGPALELGLDGARRAPRPAWAPAVANARAELISQLVAFWTRVRNTVLLPKEIRAERLTAVDEGVAGLDSALVDMLDESLDRDAAVARLEAALIRLSDAFTALDNDAVRRDAVTGTAGTFLEAVGGVLGGTVPKLALIIVLRTVPLPTGCLNAGAALDAYLKDGSRDHLMDAALILARECRLSEQPATENVGWPCPCCGVANPLGTDACRGCGEKTSRAFDDSFSLEA